MTFQLTQQNLLIIVALVGAGLALGYFMFKGDKVSVANPSELPTVVTNVKKTVADAEAKADISTLAADFVADADALGKLGFTLNHPAIAGTATPAKTP